MNSQGTHMPSHLAKPVFVSRALFRIHRELSSPERAPTSKRLYFTKPMHLLENRMGEKFRLQIGNARISEDSKGSLEEHIIQEARILRQVQAHTPGISAQDTPGAYVKFTSCKSGNYVQISKLYSFALVGEPMEYCKPPKRMRGYGFLPIAIHIASTCLAEPNGITDIAIEPGSIGADEYYKSCGFVRRDNYWGLRFFPLKTINP